MKRKSFRFKSVIFALIITACLIVLARPIYQKLNISDESGSMLCWSTTNYNGVKTIQGINCLYATGKLSTNSVLSIDSFDNGDYFSLTYPFQSENIVYYTTTNTKTAEECIIAKTVNDYKKFVSKDPQTNEEYQYYRRNNEWNIIISKYGHITYKRVIDDKIYYKITFEGLNSDSEIWCYNIKNKTDELIVSDVGAGSFDVNENGDIIYVNSDSFIIFNNNKGEQNLGKGETACFRNNSNILKVTKSGVYSVSLIDKQSEKICKATGYEVIISPAMNYIALRYTSFYKGESFNYINVIDLATGRVNKIKQAPDDIYGIAWMI